MAARKKTSTSSFSAGSGRVSTAYGTVRPKTRRRKTTSDPANKLAPLPESCHYSRSAAKKAADALREKKIKSRVVTSGQFFCVYSVGKCRKGTLVGTGKAKTTRKKKSA